MGGSGWRTTGIAVVLPVLLAAGCAQQVSTPAAPSTVSVSPSPDPHESGLTQQEWGVQDQLTDLAEKIETGHGETVPGYAGLRIDVKQRSVDVYWVGEPSERVRRIAGAPPPDIMVSLHPAVYDLKTMLAAIDRVLKSYRGSVNGGSPAVEGTGITAYQTAADAMNGPSSADLARVAGMPVTVEIGGPAVAVDG